MIIYDRLLVFGDFKPQNPTQKNPKMRKITHGRFWPHLTMRTPDKAISIKPAFRQNGSAASSHLMHIKAARLVLCDESDEVEHLNCGTVKELSGGGGINARELFCKTKNYTPHFKLCLLTNYRPIFPADDLGLIRRLLLIMFDKLLRSEDQIDEYNPMHKPIDTSLKAYMESDEGAADTLDFCVEGAKMYYARKAASPEVPALAPIPKLFSAAVEGYMAGNDQLKAFITDCCMVGKQHKVTKREFASAYANFLREGSHDTAMAGDGILLRAMLMKNILQKPSTGSRRMIRMTDGSKRRAGGFFGIRLKTDAELSIDDGEPSASGPSVAEPCLIKIPGT
jgi:phage/plasmid-associated DNA primase